MSDETPGLDDLLRLLIDQAADHALILLDARGIVVGWLAGAESIFGYTAQEIVGKNLDDLFTPEDRERGVPQHELEVARQDGRAEDDRWQLRKDGTRIWAVGAVTPLRDSTGSVVGFGKVLRDRTDARAHVEALEHRADTAALANKRKRVFLGTLAHELRNPLAPLANAVELLKLEKNQSEPVRFAVEVMERQLGTMKRLIDDLLDIARIEAGKIRIDKKPLEIGQVLVSAADSCRERANERRQDFRVILLPARTMIEGDVDRLQQVVVNLLHNAIKYTPEGGGIWLKQTVEGDEAVVRVQDTGMGIAANMLPRIFELFTQEESSYSRAEGGLGLGLPLVKEIVALHGGTVQVRSDGKNKGSEFTIRLPLAPRQ